MKAIVLWAAVGFLCVSTFAQTTSTNAPPIKIPAREAKQHLDADAMVTGKIAEVNRTERLVRLNFDRPYPNQTFTAVIFANKTNLFPGVDKLKDKTVEISGKIANYRGRPEIILISTNQLKVIETEAR